VRPDDDVALAAGGKSGVGTARVSGSSVVVRVAADGNGRVVAVAVSGNDVVTTNGSELVDAVGSAAHADNG